MREEAEWAACCRRAGTEAVAAEAVLGTVPSSTGTCAADCVGHDAGQRPMWAQTILVGSGTGGHRCPICRELCPRLLHRPNEQRLQETIVSSNVIGILRLRLLLPHPGCRPRRLLLPCCHCPWDRARRRHSWALARRAQSARRERPVCLKPQAMAACRGRASRWAVAAS